MPFIGQITTSLNSPVIQMTMLAAGAIVFFVAVKIGGFILKMLAGVAVMGVVIWQFLPK